MERRKSNDGATTDKVKLSPRFVNQDGNQFFTYISMELFNSYDRDNEIRRRVWNLFCSKVFGTTLEYIENIDPGSVEFNTLAIVEVSFQCEFFVEWINLVHPVAFKGEYVSDPDRLKRLVDKAFILAVVDTVKRNSVKGCFSPLYVVIPLVVQCYDVGIILYDNNNNNLNEKCVPFRQWMPSSVPSSSSLGSARKVIHLLRAANNGGSLGLLSISSSSKNNNNRMREQYHNPGTKKSVAANNYLDIDPQKVVVQLSKTQNTPLLNVHDQFIKTHAVYFLSAFDSETKKYFIIAPFVSPGTKLDDNICTIHYLPIDATRGKDNKTFSVIIPDEKQQNSSPFYIYAVTVKNGIRYAALIGFWDVNPVNPFFTIQSGDQYIVLVPSLNQQQSSQIITKEFYCRIADNRPLKLC